MVDPTRPLVEQHAEMLAAAQRAADGRRTRHLIAQDPNSPFCAALGLSRCPWCEATYREATNLVVGTLFDAHAHALRALGADALYHADTMADLHAWLVERGRHAQ